jgi:4-amino-4-deoxy-L-arabinose transferase-like glycosyltransferase
MSVRPLALVCLVLVVAVYLVGLGGGFGNSDEVIYAEFIRAMHRTGEYLTLRYDGATLVQRPAAPIAVYALVARLVPGEVGLRLVPALAAALGAALTCAIAWRSTGRAAIGLVALLICAGTPTVYQYGRLLLSDPPFVLACVAALGATMAAKDNPRYVAWALVALGAAFATKSMAAVIPSAALLPWLLFHARRHRSRPELKLARGLIGFVVLAAPFYVLGLLWYGRRFLDEHMGNILLERARGQLEGIGIGGPLSYLRHMWLADGPVLTVVLLGGVVLAAGLALWRKDEVLGVPASFALATLGLLSVLGTRLAHYLLPFYPAAALCVALVVSRAAEHLASRAYAEALAVALGACLFALTLAAPIFDDNIVSSHEARTLGRAAQAATAPGQAVYSLDWYAPALGYYADRSWRFLTTYPRVERIVGSVDPYRQARTVALVPPWPEGSWLLAGHKDALVRAPGVEIVRTVAEDGEYALWEARAR